MATSLLQAMVPPVRPGMGGAACALDWVPVACPLRQGSTAHHDASPAPLSPQEAADAEAFRRWGQLLAQDYDRSHGGRARS